MATDDPMDGPVLDRDTEEMAIADPDLDGALSGLSLGLRGELRIGDDVVRSPRDGVTPHRESNFNKQSGRFHDPGTGEFEEGRPPPDLDPSADRYRGKDGRFKKSSADLYDEEEEVLLDSLDPEG